MKWKISVCKTWTLVLLVVLICPNVISRPQESSPSPSNVSNTSRYTTASLEVLSTTEPTSTLSATLTASRDVKSKTPVIGESIKVVANQLLKNSTNFSTEAKLETKMVTDTRVPPKLKSQISHKHKTKTNPEYVLEPNEKSHAGEAVPITIEELESEVINESSTPNEGISTWILLSNPNGNETSSSTEPVKVEQIPKKPKPAGKNKPKRPQNTKPGKRPIIGSTNKADLVASGSAINENVYNKIKDTVLSNVQKNKKDSAHRTTTVSTTSVATTEIATTKKENIGKPLPTLQPVNRVTSKIIKKKNKNKNKVFTTPAPVISDSALLPVEAKEQEIELEVSTPATTTKKPRRSSHRKKNKTKKRKSKPKKEEETVDSDVKLSNKTTKTKSKKPSKKTTAVATTPITSQIYNYFSREVMPSVGVGVIGLAGLVGIASYFLYPFSTPVRRTFEVDKKDDLYRLNGEEYANEGNGQAEEEMLSTVLAGIPAHNKQKINPYATQTTAMNRYSVKKPEQDLRYRQVSNKYEPNYNVRYPQQKTGIAHGAVYTQPANYNPQQYETRHAYTTESKYTYAKADAYPVMEPIYAAPQVSPTGGSSFGNDGSNSVVYGVKPSPESDFKPVYPFEGQFYGQTTNSPAQFSPTSMYLGSNDDTDDSENNKYDENSDTDENIDSKFVVGNVPKELEETATPAIVPEHGPRKLNRKRRSVPNKIEELLREAKEKNKDVFLSNEIEDFLGDTTRYLAPATEAMPLSNDIVTPTKEKEVFAIYAQTMAPKLNENSSSGTLFSKTAIVESVSTLPIDGAKVTDTQNGPEVTTKPFKVYEVFSTNNPLIVTEQKSQFISNDQTSTTQVKNENTETTTDLKTVTSTVSSSLFTATDSSEDDTLLTSKPKPTYYPEVITYPPLNQDGGGFFGFIKRLIEFKYRLGLSLLQTTSENLNKYLRSMEESVQKASTKSVF